MSNKSWAFAALTALALSAQAQVYNWTLSTTGLYNPGNGSGTLTLTGGVVTAMTGTQGGGNVVLIPAGTSMGINGEVNSNRLPLDQAGLQFKFINPSNDLIFVDLFGDGTAGGSVFWYSGFTGQATFTYTPVPEPSTWAMGGAFGLAAVMTVAARRRQRANEAGPIRLGGK